MPFWRRLAGGVEIRSTEESHAAPLEALQNLVFPELAPEERFRAEHYLRHLELFPQGQFVALISGTVVGMTSTLRLSEGQAFADHTFAEVIAGGTLESHEPDGLWLYGADVGVHPDYRGRGIGRGLYAARHILVDQLQLAGQVTVGMLNGFAASSADSITNYYRQLVAGELTDPTVSAQMRVGFELRGLVENYVDDPTCGNAGVRLVLPRSCTVSAHWEQS